MKQAAVLQKPKSCREISRAEEFRFSGPAFANVCELLFDVSGSHIERDHEPTVAALCSNDLRGGKFARFDSVFKLIATWVSPVCRDDPVGTAALGCLASAAT